MPTRLNLPPVTRVVLFVLLSQTFLGFAIKYRHWTRSSQFVIAWLALLPNVSLIYPWTLLTTTLFEKNLVTLAISAVTIFYSGRYLERAWTSVEFAKFLLVASLIPNVLCYGFLTILFTLTGQSHWMLITINGTIGLQIAFLVAFSQLIPAHTVTIFKGIICLRVPRFPLLYILGISLLTLAPVLSMASFLLVITGFLTSWTYLRFFKQSFPDLQTSQSSLRGDSSESFALVEFFPGALKPVISLLSNSIYNILVKLHICPPFPTGEHSLPRIDSLAQRNTPGTARAEAERRRALALKALDQRLHAATASYSKPHNPGSTVSVPNFQLQTQPNMQAPIAMLGETNYNPEREEDK
ncbi:BgTH12-03659 [Blumeria graminis f. sp. triticale]|uniref:Bgt-1570 n=3 Tax=Blumeria graminis TaxID=34373 RepID=A0A9X9PRC8_BLUGR|nr:BgTH12-03659 [Blumeria graminis f. sp. triticale]VCU39714.1 Bgt-1570 [Blumeria graminis f. sp. tritici]